MRDLIGALYLVATMAAADPAPLQNTPPAVRMPFPAIKDWSSLRIRLQRTMCYGWCPVYTVEIAGDGTVTYIGEHFVEAKGTQTVQVSAEKVQALYEAFAKADFFLLRPSYRGAITDMPTQILTISFDGRTKTVEDYAGSMAGMPPAVVELEKAVDETAGTARWIGHTRAP